MGEWWSPRVASSGFDLRLQRRELRADISLEPVAVEVVDRALQVRPRVLPRVALAVPDDAAGVRDDRPLLVGADCLWLAAQRTAPREIGAVAVRSCEGVGVGGGPGSVEVGDGAGGGPVAVGEARD